MKLVNELCHRLGISHYDLSIFLDAPRTTITKAATAQRNLPTPYLLKLSELHNMVNSLPDPVGPSNNIDRNIFKYLKEENEHRLALFERELAALRLQYIQTATLLMLLEIMQQRQLSEKQQNWCELLKYKAQKKQENAGLHRQTELVALIQITEKTILIYRNLANTWSAVS